MKKLMFCLVAAAMAFCATESANAQKVGFGVKAGANLSTWSTDDSEMRLGFHAGLYANVKFNRLLAVQAEALYSMEGNAWSEDWDEEVFGTTYFANYDFTATVHKLAVPVLLQITPIKPLTVEVGPQFGFNLGMSGHSSFETNVIGQTNHEEDVTYDSDDYNMFELGLAAGVKLNLAGNMSVGARYVYGITPLMDEVIVNNRTVTPAVNTHNLMVSFSYGF